MKCLAVFSTLPDLLYLWKDRQFQTHLIETAIKNGLVDESTVHDEEAVISYAGHFFSPLVTSNKYMKELGNSYKSMFCENGFIFVMSELSNLYFVAACGDGEESELFLRRKINVFYYLLRLYYGPCASDHLKPQYPMIRKQTWKDLEELLQTWQTLCEQEQMFLAEALERLHVNPQLNNVSLNLLGDVLLKTNRDGHTVHALLLVNNKLLGLYSNENSPELRVSDILMLIVIVKNKFKYSDDTVPNSCHRTPPPLSSHSTQLTSDEVLFHFKSQTSKPVDVIIDEDSSSSSKQDFHSASSTPQSSSFHTPKVTTLAFAGDNSGADGVVDFDLKMNEADLEYVSNSTDDDGDDETDDDRNKTEEIRHSDSSSTTTPSLDFEPIDDEDEEDDGSTKDTKDEKASQYFQQSIFLRAGDCGYAPHTAHCVLLDKATVLIIISQNRHTNLATYIQNLLRCLKSILKLNIHKLPSYRARLLDDGEKCINKILSVVYKQVDLESTRLLQSVRMFEKYWKLVQDGGIDDFIHGEQTAEEIPQRLENSLNELIKSTKALFTSLFISKTQRRLSRYEKQLKVILNIREMATRRLRHFSSYLQVRGQRNVTMTAYHNDFPGLIHFVYVNRSTDQLIAPTINVNTDSKSPHKLPIYIVIKQRIWDMWQYSETMLTDGYTAIMVREGDFMFSYFLWFEDMLGKPLYTKKSLKDLNENKPSGIMSGTFYKDIIRYLFPSESSSSVQCYELLCMHIGAVSNHFVATSCRKLTKVLWEASGETNSPINLL